MTAVTTSKVLQGKIRDVLQDTAYRQGVKASLFSFCLFYGTAIFFSVPLSCLRKIYNNNNDKIKRLALKKLTLNGAKPSKHFFLTPMPMGSTYVGLGLGHELSL